MPGACRRAPSSRGRRRSESDAADSHRRESPCSRRWPAPRLPAPVHSATECHWPGQATRGRASAGGLAARGDRGRCPGPGLAAGMHRGRGRTRGPAAAGARPGPHLLASPPRRLGVALASLAVGGEGARRKGTRAPPTGTGTLGATVAPPSPPSPSPSPSPAERRGTVTGPPSPTRTRSRHSQIMMPVGPAACRR